MRRLFQTQLAALLCGGIPARLLAQSGSQSTINVSGFAMLDAGYNADQIDPNWYDVIRTTKLPAFKNQFAPDGNTYCSVRQSRLGVKANIPTALGDLKTTFEVEMFAVGKPISRPRFAPSTTVPSIA